MRKLLLMLLTVGAASCGQEPRNSGNLLDPQSGLPATSQIEHFQQTIEAGQADVPAPAGTMRERYVTATPEAAPADGEDTITPPSMNVTIAAGSCLPVHKQVDLSGTGIQRADILFAVDLTGSMVGELAALQTGIQDIIDQLGLLIDDPAFGVVSYMDYPAAYESCGYAAAYGVSGDLPYILNQPINADPNPSKAAIAGLALGNGFDGPESYSRVLYETYADPNIQWRAGARRIVVNVGDNIPHDCDLGACLTLALGTTGVDPGRDGVAGTADDLAILDVVDGMATNNIALLQIYSGTSTVALDLWSCWAARTDGGTAVQINEDGSIPGGLSLAQLIVDRVSTVAQRCGNVTLAASAGFETWIQNLTPAGYPAVELPASLGFDFDLCVPAGTAPGTYTFEICAYCDGGVRVCEQDTVVVVDTEVAFFTGGGHLLFDGNRFTFGFNAGPRQVGGPVKGQLEFNDHGAKKKVHSTSIDSFQVFDDCVVFEGTCKVNNAAGFTYRVRACDYAEPGKDADVFGIQVWDSGGDLVCSAGGPIAGGNIQKHVVVAMVGAP